MSSNGRLRFCTSRIPTLISCKILKIEKSWNFHILKKQPFYKFFPLFSRKKCFILILFCFQTWNQGLKAACTKFDSPMGRSSPWIPFWHKWRSSPKRVKSEKLWDYAKMPIEHANLVNVLLEHGGTKNYFFLFLS